MCNMTLTKTPLCEFGKKADFFKLKSTENKNVDLEVIKGTNGLLLMFICNHCPYVVATIKEIVETSKELKKYKINSLAIMSNDTNNYQEDSFDNMILFTKKYNFDFPYVIDEDQSIAKKYGAVCTPDFFGYNKDLELQYRGRIREFNNLKPTLNSSNELLTSMIQIAETGIGPKNQKPSMGCSIKWFK
jgi:peroxiredoxin